MRCEYCKQFRKDFTATLAKVARRWEGAESNAEVMWDIETKANLDLLLKAADHSDEGAQELAFALYEQAALNGSAKAHDFLGAHFYKGEGTEKDLERARQHYRKSHDAGSQLGSLSYAKSCYEQGNDEESRAAIDGLIAAGFGPAAYYRCFFRRLDDRDSFGKTWQEYLKLAAAAGHPEAMFSVARAMLKGKHGILKIPKGTSMFWEVFRMVRAEMPDE